MNWFSKPVGVGASLGSLCDGLRLADGGITGQRSFGLSLSDQIDALSSREFGLTEWAKDNHSIIAQHQLFISYRATDLLNDMQPTAPVSIFFDGLDQLLECNVATYMGAVSSGVLACKANATRWSEEEIRHSWLDLTKLRWERNWFRNASSNVRSWVTYLDEYIGSIRYGREDAWTNEFLKLDPSVLEKMIGS
ncbi:MAG TPA: hypothetical protein VIJ01_08540 [Candidatus Angelobacter sp.]